MLQQQQPHVDPSVASHLQFPVIPPAQILKPELTAKESYRQLKRRFKFLVFENECYQEELRNLQRKLLKLSRDKNFLLDRLMLYEKLSDSSDESDSSSVTKVDEKEKKPKRKSRPSQSRKKPVEKKEPGNGQQGKKDDSGTGGQGGSKGRQTKQEPPQSQGAGPGADVGHQQGQDPLNNGGGIKDGSSVEMDKLLPDVMAQYRVERSPAQFDYMADNNLGI